MIPAELAKQILEEVPKLEGWTSPERGIELAELVYEHSIMFAVDIGTFGGRSCIPLALAIESRFDSYCASGKVITIDPWWAGSAQLGESAVNQEYWGRIPLEEIHQKFIAALWRLRLAATLIPIRAPSDSVAGMFEHIELLHIDGNHSEIASLNDAQLWLPEVKPGGVIIADDLDWTVDGVPSTVKMREFIESQCDTIKCDGHYGIYKKR